MSFVEKNFWTGSVNCSQNVYISYSLRTPNAMKSLLIAAFTICAFTAAYSQEVDNSKEPAVEKQSNLFDVHGPSEIGPPPEPLFVISEGGIMKEATKDDLGKLTLHDIESVEMLIDAASLQEYGEKGRNGVMIISVRRG